MRKKVSKVLAMTLAAALMMTATPVGATENTEREYGQEGTNTITITGEAVNDFIEVTLPGEVAINFNPDLLNIYSDDPAKVNQRPAAAIMGEDYNIVNRGQNPVRVIIKPYINLEGTGLKITSQNWPKINESGTDYKTDLNLVSGSKKSDSKEIKVAAILADAVASNAQLSDTNTDAIYEFSYAGTSGTLGRKQYVYGAEGVLDNQYVATLLSGSKNQLGSGTGVIASLTSGSYSSVKNLTSGSQVMTVVLKPNSKTEGAPSNDSITSFTFVGLANQHAEYTAEDPLNIGVVFDVMGLSQHELQNNAVFQSGSGQGAVLWSGSAYGF